MTRSFPMRQPQPREFRRISSFSFSLSFLVLAELRERERERRTRTRTIDRTAKSSRHATKWSDIIPPRRSRNQTWRDDRRVDRFWPGRRRALQENRRKDERSGSISAHCTSSAFTRREFAVGRSLRPGSLAKARSPQRKGTTWTSRLRAFASQLSRDYVSTPKT